MGRFRLTNLQTGTDSFGTCNFLSGSALTSLNISNQIVVGYRIRHGSALPEKPEPAKVLGNSGFKEEETENSFRVRQAQGMSAGLDWPPDSFNIHLLLLTKVADKEARLSSYNMG
jgi:hypothetical protein